VAHLTMLLCYGNQATNMMGVLVQAVMEAMKMEIGMSSEIFSTPICFQEVVMDTWVKHLWINCIKYGIYVYYNLSDFQPQLVQDIEIIWVFAQHGFNGQDSSC